MALVQLYALVVVTCISLLNAGDEECIAGVGDNSMACASAADASNGEQKHPLPVHDLLERAYADISKLEQLDSGSSGTVWGTLTLGALDSVYSWLNVSADDVFCDLGSGIGKPILHASLQSPPPSVLLGVEVGDTRHQAAMKALGSVENLLAETGLPPLSTRPVFKLSDLRELPKEELQQCSRVFLNNAGYPKETLSYLSSILEEKLTRRADGTKKSRRIMSLMTLPGWGPASRQGKPIKELFYNVVDASWGPVPVHIYEVGSIDDT